MREGWEYKRFNEVFDLQMGKTPSRDDPRYWGGNNIWVSIADLQGKYIGSSKEGISDTAVSESGIKIVPKDTVIMSFKLSVGRSAITTTDLYTNEAIMSFSPKPEYIIIPDYIYYYLKGYKWVGANKAVMGMTLNKKSISSNIFAIPEFKVQQQIVSELDLLSGSIEKQKAQLEELDKLAQSIFYDMFKGKEWEKKTLKAITSKMGSGATPRGGNQSYKASGISLIRSLNVHNNEFLYDDLAFIDNEQANQLNNVIIEKGDVLLNITGASVARCCLVPDDVLPARVNQHVCIIRPISQINNVFLCHFLISKDTQIDLLNLSRNNAATREALPKGLLEKFLVPLPPLSLQQEFASKVEAIESMKAKVRQSLKEAETLFNSRMDYYFN